MTKNRQLINGQQEQQIEYHKELERNFCRLTEKLAPLMGLANAKHSQALLQDTYFRPGFTRSTTTTTTNNNNSSPTIKGMNGFGRQSRI